MILGRIDCNTVNPGVESAVSPELREGPVGLQERLLGHILYLCWVSDETGDESNDFALILGDQ
jgi:hypothetical protein